MKSREYITAKISGKNEKTVRAGHPWVYGEEIRELSATPSNGELVDVLSAKGTYLGTGFYNENSKIRIRIISTNANDKFDEAFWERRIKYAYDYRKLVLGGETDACRLIFGEADTFPGLTVDKFHNVLVTEVASLGIDNIKDMLYRLLIKVLKADGVEIIGVYERNNVGLRTKEGLPLYDGWYDFGDMPIPEISTVDIEENGVKYTVDFVNGQKTGFFLDQRYNRLAIQKLAKGKTVLDCITYTGSFALNSAVGGASSVLCADISESAIEMAKHNAKLNGVENIMQFEVADVFEFLPKLDEENKKFDMVILDPPAFTKSRKTLDNALRGYGEINYRAMKLVKRGGIFATASCSHFAKAYLFVEMLKESALKAGITLRQIEARQQAPDHPILMNVPETDYLKFYIFQVV